MRRSSSAHSASSLPDARSRGVGPVAGERGHPRGDGELVVSNGGTVSNTFGRVASSPSTNGLVTVQGAGSAWVNLNDLTVGHYGDATMLIADGGTVSNVTGEVAQFAGSDVTVTVTGDGSQWNNSGTLYVGGWMIGPGGTARVTVRLNGNESASEITQPGTEQPLGFTVPRGGNNILEFEVEPVAGEITTANNRAGHVIEGIRENLRVLLVSGEPHAGERTWRNLLKSDASVDLVHFTILRPPEKQDGTPINELSLIAFPTRELFVEKIDQFDLIIFDRYQHRDVLPILYYDYIAEYVEKGGALLIAAGPEYAGENSIARTPLNAALPAMPTGRSWPSRVRQVFWWRRSGR